MQKVRVSVTRQWSVKNLVNMSLGFLILGFFGLIGVAARIGAKGPIAQPMSEFIFSCLALACTLFLPILLYVWTERFDACRDGIVWRRGLRRPVTLAWTDIKQIQRSDDHGRLVLESVSGDVTLKIPRVYSNMDRFMSILEHETANHRASKQKQSSESLPGRQISASRDHTSLKQVFMVTGILKNEGHESDRVVIAKFSKRDKAEGCVAFMSNGDKFEQLEIEETFERAGKGEPISTNRPKGQDVQKNAIATRQDSVKERLQRFAGYFVGLLLAASLLMFDLWMLSECYDQIRSARFPTTTGSIQQNTVEFQRGGRKRLSTYTLNLSYSYVVDNIPYVSDRDRFIPRAIVANSESSIRSIAAKYPIGKQVTVYYNPADPSKAILSPGWNWAHSGLAYFLIPLNCGLIFFGLLAWNGWQARFQTAGGIVFTETSRQLRIRLGELGPFQKGLAAMGIVTFAGAMVFVFIDPGMAGQWLFACLWLLAPGAFIAGLFYQRGASDLVLDRSARLITVPVTRIHQSDVEIPWNAVTDVLCSDVEHHNANGEFVSMTYEVQLKWSDQRRSHKEALVRWGNRQCAVAFSDWLRDRIMNRTKK